MKIGTSIVYLKQNYFMKKFLLLFISVSLFVIACTTNAITGRSQLSLVSEASLQSEAVTQYKTFLSQNKLSTSIASIGYEYSLNEQSGRFKANYSYTGFFCTDRVHRIKT